MGKSTQLFQEGRVQVHAARVQLIQLYSLLPPSCSCHATDPRLTGPWTSRWLCLHSHLGGSGDEGKEYRYMLANQGFLFRFVLNQGLTM